MRANWRKTNEIRGENPGGAEAIRAPTARAPKSQNRTRHQTLGGRGWIAIVAVTVALQLSVGWKFFAESEALALLWAFLGVQAVLFVVLMYAVGGLTQLDPVLDERERAARDHAMALAYRILMVVFGVIAFGILIASTAHDLPGPTAQVGAPAYVGQLLWFVVSLPLGVMSWTLPDPEPEPPE